jgi:NitT/TauT family transport system permease protein
MDEPAYGWRVRTLSLLAGCVAWEIGARLAATPFFPTCIDTVRALVTLVADGLILGSLWVSFANLSIGFAAAAIAGIAIGTAMSRFRSLDLVLEPYLHALLSAPGLIYVPILFTLFGTARVTQIGSVFLHALFAITATTVGALRPRNRSLIAMATAFGATERQVFWRVRWPEAQPLIVSGLRLGALLAVKGMINGEMFIAFTGLGALVRTYGSRFEPQGVLAVVIVVVAIAFAATGVIDAAERRLGRAA